MALMSTPFFNKCVANEWRRMWGVTFFLIPAIRARVLDHHCHIAGGKVVSRTVNEEVFTIIRSFFEIFFHQNFGILVKEHYYSFSPFPRILTVRSLISKLSVFRGTSSETLSPDEYSKASMSLFLSLKDSE